MCNNHGFRGGNCWIIILIIILFLFCGNSCGSGYGSYGSYGGCGGCNDRSDRCGC